MATPTAFYIPGRKNAIDLQLRQDVDGLLALTNTATSQALPDSLALRDPTGTISVSTPTDDDHVATKAYVDAFVTGVSWKEACDLKIVAPLPSYVKSGTEPEITYTASNNGALSVDGVAVMVGDRILLDQNLTTPADSGIFEIVQTGSGVAKWVMQRSFDTTVMLQGIGVCVLSGTQSNGRSYVLTTAGPIVPGTTSLTWVMFSSSTLSGDVSGTLTTTSISNATVTGKLLTGYSSSAGTIAATDSILGAIGKLDGNLGTPTKDNTASQIVKRGSSGEIAVSYLSTDGLGMNYLTMTTGLGDKKVLMCDGGGIGSWQSVLSVPITGYTSAAGTVGAADTLLQAFNKIGGNNIALATVVGTPTASNTASQIVKRGASSEIAVGAITATGLDSTGTVVCRGLLSTNSQAVAKVICLQDVGGGSQGGHSFYGLGLASGILRYQLPTTTSAHKFYAATSNTTSTELMGIASTGAVTIPGTLAVTGETTLSSVVLSDKILSAASANLLSANNTTGSSYIGLAANTSGTGTQNTALGKGALVAITTGQDNTSLGFAASQFVSTHSGNTALGAFALHDTSGDSNTGVGMSALYTNATGTLNTALGYQASASAGDLTNATAIGANAIVTQSNSVQLGDTSVTKVNTSGAVHCAGLTCTGVISATDSTLVTYSPTLGDGTHLATVTAAQSGYTMIGKLCFCQFQVSWTSKGDCTGYMRISLPYAASSHAGFNRSSWNTSYIRGVDTSAAGVAPLVGLTQPGNSYVELFQQDLANTGGSGGFSFNNAADSGEISISGFYVTV